MQYAEIALGTARDELAPEETRNIPFFGFITATLISLGLWSAIFWMVWAVIVD
jgi:hypothetical protein